jgi:HK97 family phage major capsid protein
MSESNPAQEVSNSINATISEGIAGVKQELKQEINEAIKSQQESESAKKVEALESELKSVKSQQEVLEKIVEEFKAFKEIQEHKSKQGVGNAKSVPMELKGIAYRAEEAFNSVFEKAVTSGKHFSDVAINDNEYKSIISEYVDTALNSNEPSLIQSKGLLKNMQKSIQNTQDASLGGFLVEAPITLGIRERFYATSAIRREVGVTSGMSQEGRILIIERTGEAKFMNETDTSFPTPAVACKLAEKKVKAQRVGATAIWTDAMNMFTLAQSNGQSFAQLIQKAVLGQVVTLLGNSYANGVNGVSNVSFESFF